MQTTLAITRAISSRFNECELTHLEREQIDLELARSQHHRYEQALHELGIQVISLPAETDLPDSVFVEDTALVLDEIALLTRPGARSRQAEVASIATALAPYRQMAQIEAPGSLDGGDILRLGKEIYVGLSTRSNQAAIEQLRTILTPYGYNVSGLALNDCLHLKSAVTQASPDTLLINPAWIDKSHFPGWKFIEVSPDEPSAANILMLPVGAIFPDHFPKTQKRLLEAGIHLTIVPASEVSKAEGAVTCCSLIFSA